jgi:hypothetical protein
VAASGGVLIFLLAFVFQKKNLDNSDFSWRRHFLFLRGLLQRTTHPLLAVSSPHYLPAGVRVVRGGQNPPHRGQIAVRVVRWTATEVDPRRSLSAQCEAEATEL